MICKKCSKEMRNWESLAWVCPYCETVVPITPITYSIGKKAIYDVVSAHLRSNLAKAIVDKEGFVRTMRLAFGLYELEKERRDWNRRNS